MEPNRKRLIVTRLSDVPDLAPEVAKTLGVSENKAADLLRAKGYLQAAAALLDQILDGRAQKSRSGSAEWRAQAAHQILASEPEETDPVAGWFEDEEGA